MLLRKKETIPSINPNNKAKHVNSQMYGVWLKDYPDYHNNFSVHNTSGIIGGRFDELTNRIIFKNGLAEVKISSLDKVFMEALMLGIQKNPFIETENFKFNIIDIRSENFKASSREHKFFTTSPVFLQSLFAVDGKRIHYTFKDDIELTSSLLTKTLKARIEKLNLAIDTTDLKVSFDNSYLGAKVKRISYKSGDNTIYLNCNNCPVIIKGSTAAIEAAYYLGIGHSTGAGFGCIDVWQSEKEMSTRINNNRK